LEGSEVVSAGNVQASEVGGQASLRVTGERFRCTSWWVQWAALGIGIAWLISLFRVMRAMLLAGGLAALGAYVARRSR